MKPPLATCLSRAPCWSSSKLERAPLIWSTTSFIRRSGQPHYVKLSLLSGITVLTQSDYHRYSTHLEKKTHVVVAPYSHTTPHLMSHKLWDSEYTSYQKSVFLHFRDGVLPLHLCSRSKLPLSLGRDRNSERSSALVDWEQDSWKSSSARPNALLWRET